MKSGCCPPKKIVDGCAKLLHLGDCLLRSTWTVEDSKLVRSWRSAGWFSIFSINKDHLLYAWRGITSYFLCFLEENLQLSTGSGYFPLSSFKVDCPFTGSSPNLPDFHGFLAMNSRVNWPRPPASSNSPAWGRSPSGSGEMPLITVWKRPG